MPVDATDPEPLAYVAASRGGTSRARKDLRLAAVLAEFGYRTHIAVGGGEPWDDVERLEALDDAAVVVCDVVSPAGDIPMEAALAATRGARVLVLMPAGVEPGGLAADLLDSCGATVVRYDGVEPHRALHARLLADTRAGRASAEPKRFVRA